MRASIFRKTDTLLLKKYASCSFGTDLVPRLARASGRYVRHHRLHHERMRARDRGRCLPERVPSMVVREAVGDRSAAAHAQSLFDLDAKYADAISQQDALAYLERVGYSSAGRS